MEAPEADPQEVSDQQRYDEIVDAVASRVLSSKCLLLNRKTLVMSIGFYVVSMGLIVKTVKKIKICR